MSDPQPLEFAQQANPPRWFWFGVIAGAFLTLRGYHSFDGDQAYRLPLLLHRQDPSLYATDPFVRAFDVFNPHRGYLTLLDGASRPWGLATGLLGLFALTLALTMLGVDWLARVVWPDRGGRVGLVAVVLVLTLKAGNIGTNHLFEATLLDRLVAFGLGWLAIAAALADPERGARIAAPCLGLATLIHPSVGLQLSLTLAAGWMLWGLNRSRSGGTIRDAGKSTCFLAVALVPGLTLIGGQSGQLMAGVPLDEFRRWAVEVQGPQHMLPSTWRMPQWLAFGWLAGLGTFSLWSGRPGAGAFRLGGLLAVNAVSLALAYGAVEIVGDLRVTLFQPFRMATLTRGLGLVALAGRLVDLWDRGDLTSRGRAVLLAVSLVGDWSLVVAAVVEVGMTLAERWGGDRVARGVGGLVLMIGLIWLSRHDTESGHIPILAALGAVGVGSVLARVRPLVWNRRRLGLLMGLAWAMPVLAAGAGLAWGDRAGDHPVGRFLVGRWRFAEIPIDPAERVAVWCQTQTPPGSRFIVPPGEKEFRLWSRRAVAFNRAASPYHALGLLDWSKRFRAHVGFTGTSADFARAYLMGRHQLERAYATMSPEAKLALARDQGATHILERLPSTGPALADRAGQELLIQLGGYAVYQVREPIREMIPEKRMTDK